MLIDIEYEQRQIGSTKYPRFVGNFPVGLIANSSPNGDSVVVGEDEAISAALDGVGEVPYVVRNFRGKSLGTGRVGF